MIQDFITALLDVYTDPVVPFVRHEWLKRSPVDGSIFCACPLTQIAIKAGMGIESPEYGPVAGSSICLWVQHHFQVEHWVTTNVFSNFDDGLKIPVIAGILEDRFVAEKGQI